MIISEERSDYEISGAQITLQGVYLVNQWVHIQGSILNDGIYRVKEVSGSLYTLENGTDVEIPTQGDEAFTGIIRGLRIDPSFIALTKEILTFNTESGTPTAYQSESVLGVHSWTRATGENGAPIVWQQVFADRINPYKRLMASVVV